jgi:CBS domain-containing protein
MKAQDVMTRQLITVAPDSSILEALRLMLQHRISGLPVVDKTGNVVGIVSEGDFIRRAETDTQQKRPRWLQFVLGPGRLADDYVHTRGRRVDEVMTADVVAVTEHTSLDDVVALMEKYRIKRVPVMHENQFVGIVSRANLLRAIAGAAGNIIPAPQSDEAIRNRVMTELDRQSWAPGHLIDVVVHDGAVELWGTVFDARQRDAARVVAENVEGIKAVRSHITWIEPMSGMVFSDAEDEVGSVNPPADASTSRSEERRAATVS